MSTSAIIPLVRSLSPTQSRFRSHHDALASTINETNLADFAKQKPLDSLPCLSGTIAGEAHREASCPPVRFAVELNSDAGARNLVSQVEY
jgi:hypothetical protein